MEEEDFPKSLQNAKENLIGVLENKTEFFIQHKAKRPTSRANIIIYIVIFAKTRFIGRWTLDAPTSINSLRFLELKELRELKELKTIGYEEMSNKEMSNKE